MIRMRELVRRTLGMVEVERRCWKEKRTNKRVGSREKSFSLGLLDLWRWNTWQGGWRWNCWLKV